MVRTRFPWLKLRKKTDPELPLEPPLWMKSYSNGEHFQYQTPHQAKVRDEILKKADENARILGMERREFLASAMGMATTLLVINACESAEDSAAPGAGGAGGAGGGGGSGGAAGGGYCVDPEAMFDEDAACEAIGGDEFIFDIQTHHFDPDGQWTTHNLAYMQILQDCGMATKQDCYSLDRYVELIFMESDTTMTCLSSWPAAACSNARPIGCGLPLTNDSMAESRRLVNAAAGSQRMLNHCQIMPNDPDGIDKQLAMMEKTCELGVDAWKLYPAWGPELDTGFFLDDPKLGIPIIEKGLELGVGVFCVHKGLPLPGFDIEHDYPWDIGRVAKKYPEAKFIVYHSAICAGMDYLCLYGTGTQGDGYPYDEAIELGANTLIKSLIDNGIKPNSNVYAELGSAYTKFTSSPTKGAHFIGKLLKYVGEDNVCWGTDSMVTGNPQSLIESMRALTISQELQDQYGYPELTKAVKAKIFGLNSAKAYGVDVNERRCKIDTSKLAYTKRLLDGELGPRRHAFRQPLGPKTRREFFESARRSIASKRPG